MMRKPTSTTATIATIILSFLLVICSYCIVGTHASIPCVSHVQCQELYKTTDTDCLAGRCSNPYQRACLPTKRRVCNSDDIRANAHLTNELCFLTEFDYPEIRIYQNDWEASIFQAWIYQILLMEVLGVPVTIGSKTGETANASFYSPINIMPYGTSKDTFYKLERANQVKDNDCSNTNEECVHVVVEDWGREWVPFLQNGSIVPPSSNGGLGIYSIYIPKVTAIEYPELSIHFGLTKGTEQEQRQRLADIFYRPTNWKDYCELVSLNNCTIPDATANRRPKDDNEATMYFHAQEYRGYFRATERNNCSNNNNADLCSGHIANVPCNWNFYLEGMLYWNNIVGLEYDGPNEPNGGYSDHQLRQIWRAANATRSHIIMVWYSPDQLMEEFYGTDYEFNKVQLPTPTDVCLANRPNTADRCSANIEQRRGQKEGSCDRDPHKLVKLISSSLLRLDRNVEDAQKSPAFDLIRDIRISQLDIHHMMKKWLEIGVDEFGNDARTAVCRWLMENQDVVIPAVPFGYPRQIDERNQYDDWFVVLAQLIAILVGFVAIIGIVLCWYYRQTKVLIFAQPEFVFIMLIGYCSLCAGAALLAFEPTKNTCISLTWLLILGITIEMVPVVVKTAAINRLVQSSKKSLRVNISRRRLLCEVFSCTVLVTAYTLAWTLVDPPTRNVTTRIDPDDQSIVITDTFCESEYYYWRIVAFSWQFLLLVLAAVLAFQSRGVLKEFNESNALGLLVYSHFMFMCLRGILNAFYYFSDFSFAVITVALSLNYSVDTLIAMLVYIYPKFYQAKNQPLNYLQQKLASAAAKSQKSSTSADSSLQILCCTANIGNAEPTQESMEAWIPPRGACEQVRGFDGAPLRREIFDLIIVGMQESTWVEEVKKKKIAAINVEMDEEYILNAMEKHHTATLRGLMQDILGREYSPMVEELRGQMRLFVWASHGVIDDIKDVRLNGANTGVGGVMNNKGGIVVSLRYNSTRLSFLSAHLAAHEGESYYKARCDNIQTIIRDSNTFALSSKLDAAVSSHHMFVMGDLNFRTKFDGVGRHDDNVRRALDLIEKKNFEELYKFDELQRGLEVGDLLLGFETPPCLFPPTFKVQREHGWIFKEQRTPSYTDRILFKSAEGLQDCLQPIAYEPCPDFITSDHKPIRGAFSIRTEIEESCYGEEVDIKMEFQDLQCFDLPAADSNGSSDPYLLFLWDESLPFETGKKSFPDKIRTFINGRSWPRTKFLSRTLNPKWEGQTVSLVATKAKFASEGMLYVVAMDYDTLSLKDDFLGALALPLRELSTLMNEETETVLEIDRPLQRGGKAAGRIKFQLYIKIKSRAAFSFASIASGPSLRALGNKSPFRRESNIFASFRASTSPLVGTS